MLLGLIPAAAQDTTANPLLDMLALVPDTDTTRAGVPVIGYVDYRALEAMRGIPTPNLDSTDALRDEAGGIWLASMMSVSTGLDLSGLADYVGGMRDAVGISLGEIDRSLVFGAPPQTGTLLGGAFAVDAIAAAYLARGYTFERIDDVPVWCGPGGCEDGQSIDFANRNRANPFGGALGRNELLAYLSAYMADSPALDVMQGMIAAAQDTAPSLADDPAYRAAAEASLAGGTLLQVQFFDASNVSVFMAEPGQDLPAPVKDAIAAYQPLPPYLLFGLADVWKDDQEITLLLLVYPDAAQAETAAAELTTRLQTFASITANGRLVPEMIAERGGSISEGYVYTAESGYAAAVVPIPAPVPTNERQSDTPHYRPSGIIYRLFVGEFIRRGLYPVAVDFVLPE
ncbi:MAG: hypothetical protein K8I60_09975 [Anaerolineae bacterium]|nr:hypothetical protein [Anaerolineae bacterium]